MTEQHDATVPLDQKLDTILAELRSFQADRAADRKLELIKLGVPTAVAVAALVVGFVQYIATSSLSARQPFLEKQTELCLRASEHAARLASTQDREQWEKSREEFWMLYYGPLAVVEEPGTKGGVVEMMDYFGKQLSKITGNPSSLPADELNLPSLNLAHACSALLTSKWQAGILRWFGYQ